ncbi:MAG: hypothetical protein IMZ71_01150 [Chloroflexi bacterium]|nr:hypothetical protein [Chloroflexota bacterium]
MKERPILFSGEMVRAILERRKTQTRRVIKPQPEWVKEGVAFIGKRVSKVEALCPYGQRGDRLYVKETWAVQHNFDDAHPGEIQPEWASLHYEATETLGGLLKRPSLFMPRAFSRITLEIASVRAAHIQAMNFYDWVADFCPSPLEQARALETFVGMKNMAEMAKALWDSIHGPGAWDRNDWVFVIEFKRIEKETSCEG